MAEKLTAAQKAADEEARLSKAIEVSQKAGVDLVALFDESATTFKKAKRITSWLGKGADVKLIASSLSLARAEKEYPNASDADRAFYAATKPGKGGVMVADSTIRAYSNAWASVEASGLVPTEETVNYAFKVLSKGRTAQPRKELEKMISAAIEGDEIDQVEGSRLYVAGSQEILTGRKVAEPTEGRPNDGTKKKAPIVDLAEVELGDEPGQMPVSLEGALHLIQQIAAQNWDDAERAELSAALNTAVEQLAEVEVEVEA